MSIRTKWRALEEYLTVKVLPLIKMVLGWWIVATALAFFAVVFAASALAVAAWLKAVLSGTGIPP